jgi:hypothetical protein
MKIEERDSHSVELAQEESLILPSSDRAIENKF